MIQVTIADIGKKPYIDEKASAALLAFCLERSSKTVLAREHREEISEEVFHQLVSEEAEKIAQKKEKSLSYIDSLSDKELKKEGLINRQYAVEIIHEQSEGELELLFEKNMDDFSGEDRLEEELTPYGLEKRTISIGSFTSYGPWFDLCWFSKDLPVLREVLEQDIFAFPMEVGGYNFEDPCFADSEDIVWARICSHEREITLDLSEEDYEEFLKLGISHTAYPPQKKKMPLKKGLLVGAVSAVSVLGAAMGIGFAVKKKKKQEEK